MKKLLRILGLVLGGIVLLILLVMAFINFSPAPTYDQPENVTFAVASTPEHIENGARFASMMCGVCHMGKDNRLSGHYMASRDNQLGKAIPANITQHPEYGIADWSAEDIAIFIKTGIKPDGSFTIQPWMPKWPNISDQDLNDLIAFLKSDHRMVQPVEVQHPEPKRKFLGKMLSRVAFKPYPYQDNIEERPDTMNLMALGDYLVNDLYLCYDCHSANFETNDPLNPKNSKGYMAGGNPMHNEEGELVVTTNITMTEAGIAHYNYKDFVNAVKWGKKPDNTDLRYPMLKFTALSDKEIEAMWAYIQTVKTKPATDS